MELFPEEWLDFEVHTAPVTWKHQNWLLSGGLHSSMPLALLLLQPAVAAAAVLLQPAAVALLQPPARPLVLHPPRPMALPLGKCALV